MKEWMLLRSYPWQKIIIVATAYFLIAKIGQLQAIPPGYVTAVWPSSGIALASMLWLGYRIWPGIFLGSFLTNISTYNYNVGEISLAIIILNAVFIGVGAVCQALAGRFVLEKLTGKVNFLESVNAIWIFIVCCATLACFINASIGSTSLLLFQIIPGQAYFNTWFTWWLGDLTGVIIVTPTIMAWHNKNYHYLSLRKLLEASLLIILVLVISYIAFFQNYPIKFLLIPVILWVSFNFGARFATGAGVLIYIMMICAIMLDYNNFSGESFYEAIMFEQLFITTIFISIITVATILYEREMSHKENQQLYKNLQDIIRERSIQLEQSFSLVKATLESTTDGILVVDSNGKVVDYNLQFAQMWQIPQTILDSQDDSKLIDYVLAQLQNPEEFIAKVESLYKHSAETSFDELIFNDNRIFERYSQPERIGDNIIGRVWSFRDVTRQKAMQAQLVHQATHDTLTSLPNRALLLDRIQQAILYANRHHSRLAILFVDLDRFKLINDCLGHNIGDAVLLTVANRLKKCVRAKDTIARIGGDEFVIILTELQSEQAIHGILEKIIDSFKTSFRSKDYELHLTASIGISFYAKDGRDAETLLKNADSAMYKAKESGRNTFNFFTENISEENAQRLILENNLYSAYLHNEFILQYQPIISFSTRKIVGAEALLYWQHPTLGLIAPSQFIKFAEASRLIIPIGEWVLRMACIQIKAWQAAGLLSAFIAVNISAQQFNQMDFINVIDNILINTGLSPRSLELELTESVLFNNSEKNLTVMSDLKQRGISLVLDDFGTGYSSLDYLSKFPINKIKIDRGFINSMTTDSSNIAIIKAIVEMANSLNLKMVAEGIETEEQFAIMQKLGCQEAQGYLLAKPVAAQAYEQLLRKNPTF